MSEKVEEQVKEVAEVEVEVEVEVEEEEPQEQAPEKPKEDEEETPEEGRQQHQENLFTRVVNFDRKSYFLDVRENNRGKYLKLTESSVKRRSTILLSGHVVGILVQILDDAIKENYPPSTAEIGERWATVFSRRVVSPQKKIYFDLMQNKFGRSLNVAEVSQTRPKTAVIVSEHGWLQLKRALDEILQEFPVFQPPAPRGEMTQITSKTLQLQSKRFYFDLMENEIGRFIKLSEVKKGRRETLYIPQICFEIIATFLGNLEEEDYEAEMEGLVSLEMPESEPEGHSTLLRKMLKLEADEEANNKTFHLDFRENSFGKFLRLTEVRPGRSSAVFLPADSFIKVKDILNELASTP